MRPLLRARKWKMNGSQCTRLACGFYSRPHTLFRIFNALSLLAMNSSTKFHWECCTHSCTSHTHTHASIIYYISFMNTVDTVLYLGVCWLVCFFFLCVANWVDHFNVSIVQMLNRVLRCCAMSYLFAVRLFVCHWHNSPFLNGSPSIQCFGKCQCVITVIFFHFIPHSLALFNNIQSRPVGYVWTAYWHFVHSWIRIWTTFLLINSYRMSHKFTAAKNNKTKTNIHETICIDGKLLQLNERDQLRNNRKRNTTIAPRTASAR